MLHLLICFRRYVDGPISQCSGRFMRPLLLQNRFYSSVTIKPTERYLFHLNSAVSPQKCFQLSSLLLFSYRQKRNLHQYNANFTIVSCDSHWRQCKKLLSATTFSTYQVYCWKQKKVVAWETCTCLKFRKDQASAWTTEFSLLFQHAEALFMQLTSRLSAPFSLPYPVKDIATNKNQVVFRSWI